MPKLSSPVGIGVVVLCLIVIGVGVFFAIGGGQSEGPEDEVTLRQVAQNPEEYEGQEVTVSGQLAESDYFTQADANVVIPLGAETDGQVLVLPQESATVPELVGDAVLRVTGTVRSIESGSGGNGGSLPHARLLSESGAAAAIEATEVSVAGGDLDDIPSDPPARRATVSQLLRDPAAFNDQPVLVPGTVVAKFPGTGFVLAGNQGDTQTIFVGVAPGNQMDEVSEGDRVRVRAELERISRFRADTIAEALAGTPETDASTPEGVDLDQTPTEEGRPFLVFRGVRPPAGENAGVSATPGRPADRGEGG